MADFSHLKNLDVQAKTTRYQMDQITVNGMAPVFIVASATEANKPYFNALLKKANQASKAVRRGKISSDLISKNRAEDRDLYPKHIILGWEDVLDSDGATVPYSKAEAKELIESLPDWLFDDLRTFCGDPANFADTLDVEIIAKN